MIVEILLAVIAAVLVPCAIAQLLARRPRRRFRRAVRKRVVVHTNQGYSIDGVLSGLYADGMSVENASLIRSNGEPDVPLGGAQILPWESVEWVQELAGTEDAER